MFGALTLLAAAFTALLAAPTAAHADAGLPHVDSCNYCFECLPGLPAAAAAARNSSSSATAGAFAAGDLGSDAAWASEPDAVYEAAAAASGIPGAVSSPHAVTPALVGPTDHTAKQLKPNCTRCRGCSTILTDMNAAPVTAAGMDGLAFKHDEGLGTGWVFFGSVPGAPKRYVVKVYCMPYMKRRDMKRKGGLIKCGQSYEADRMRQQMAQARLTNECGATGTMPRVWVAPVNGIVPSGALHGYHVRWHGLWMEEAAGITIQGLHAMEGAQRALYDLLTRRMNTTQVIYQTVFDLLTAQCDRHSGNVAITPSGQLTFIDNEHALGFKPFNPRCGADSMLLPGSSEHTSLRVGNWGTIFRFYQSHAHKPKFCTGPIDVRVVIDYRCYVPGGRLGTAFPGGLRSCMSALARARVPAIMVRYGFTSRRPAEILKRRARDMLVLGFERALAVSPPRSGPQFAYTPQPPCCRMVLDTRQRPHCAQCWQPVLERDRRREEDVPGAVQEPEALIDAAE